MTNSRSVKLESDRLLLARTQSVVALKALAKCHPVGLLSARTQSIRSRLARPQPAQIHLVKYQSGTIVIINQSFLKADCEDL
jgi:hypothetical protein